MKRGTLVVGGGVGLVLLGAYFLGNLFNGGWGVGPGSNDGTGQDGGKNADPDRVINSTEQPDDGTTPTSAPNSSGIAGVNLGKVVPVVFELR